MQASIFEVGVSHFVKHVIVGKGTLPSLKYTQFRKRVDGAPERIPVAGPRLRRIGARVASFRSPAMLSPSREPKRLGTVMI